MGNWAEDAKLSSFLGKKDALFGLNLPAGGERELRQNASHEKPQSLSARQVKISIPDDYFAQYLCDWARRQRPACFLKKPNLYLVKVSDSLLSSHFTSW